MIFLYQAFSKNKKQINGFIKGISKEKVFKKLSNLWLIPTKITPTSVKNKIQADNLGLIFSFVALNQEHQTIKWLVKARNKAEATKKLQTDFQFLKIDLKINTKYKVEQATTSSTIKNIKNTLNSKNNSPPKSTLKTTKINNKKKLTSGKNLDLKELTNSIPKEKLLSTISSPQLLKNDTISSSIPLKKETTTPLKKNITSNFQNLNPTVHSFLKTVSKNPKKWEKHPFWWIFKEFISFCRTILLISFIYFLISKNESIEYVLLLFENKLKINYNLVDFLTNFKNDLSFIVLVAVLLFFFFWWWIILDRKKWFTKTNNNFHTFLQYLNLVSFLSINLITLLNITSFFQINNNFLNAFNFLLITDIPLLIMIIIYSVSLDKINLLNSQK